MKRAIAVCTAIIMISISLPGCQQEPELVLEGANGTLVVHDKTIGRVVHFDAEKHDRVELPLVILWQALGAKFEWTDETVATVEHNDELYRLDIERPSLQRSNSDYIGIEYELYGGAYDGYYCERRDHELILDHDSLSDLLYDELHQRILIDYANKTVYIEDQ